MKKFLAVVLSFLLAVNTIYRPVSASPSLSEVQQQNRDTIVSICTKNWDKYGVLPSVCLAQAFVESTLGKHCSGYNLWGICSGAVHYGSISDGVYGYMHVINNGHYKGAPYSHDYRTQLKRILAGGYCVPEGAYYENATWAIRTYNFDKYDEKMFKELRQIKEDEKVQKEQKKTFVMKYDSSVPENAVKVDKSIIRKGTIDVYDKGRYTLLGIYDIESGSKGHVILTSNQTLNNQTVELDVHEESKG